MIDFIVPRGLKLKWTIAPSGDNQDDNEDDVVIRVDIVILNVTSKSLWITARAA